MRERLPLACTPEGADSCCFQLQGDAHALQNRFAVIWYAKMARLERFKIERNGFPGIVFRFFKGIALSIPLTGTAGLALILMLFLVLMIWFVLLIRNAQWLRASIVCVVLLGAGSNIVDRLLYDGVVDYLQVVFPSVINLADVMVMAGIAGLLVVPKHDSAQTRFAPTREN